MPKIITGTFGFASNGTLSLALSQPNTVSSVPVVSPVVIALDIDGKIPPATSVIYNDEMDIGGTYWVLTVLDGGSVQQYPNAIYFLDGPGPTSLTAVVSSTPEIISLNTVFVQGTPNQGYFPVGVDTNNAHWAQMILPPELIFTNYPTQAGGTLTLGKQSFAGNLTWLTPTGGGQPVFRALSVDDFPAGFGGPDLEINGTTMVGSILVNGV